MLQVGNRGWDLRHPERGWWACQASRDLYPWPDVCTHLGEVGRVNLMPGTGLLDGFVGRVPDMQGTSLLREVLLLEALQTGAEAVDGY